MLFSAHHPFVGQLCIAIPTNRSTPYSMLEQTHELQIDQTTNIYGEPLQK